MLSVWNRLDRHGEQVRDTDRKRGRRGTEDDPVATRAHPLIPIILGQEKKERVCVEAASSLEHSTLGDPLPCIHGMIANPNLFANSLHTNARCRTHAYIFLLLLVWWCFFAQLRCCLPPSSTS